MIKRFLNWYFSALATRMDKMGPLASRMFLGLAVSVPLSWAFLFFTYCNSMGLGNWPIHLLVSLAGSVLLGLFVGAMQYMSDRYLGRL